MRISDWSSDVCSSDLVHNRFDRHDLRSLARTNEQVAGHSEEINVRLLDMLDALDRSKTAVAILHNFVGFFRRGARCAKPSAHTMFVWDDPLSHPPRPPSEPIPVHVRLRRYPRSEEHTPELQSLMRISYAVFCLKKKTTTNKTSTPKQTPLYITTI